jgi:signal peptidase
MARRRPPSDDEGEEEPDPIEEAEDDEPSGPPRRRSKPSARPRPVRRWRSGEPSSEEEEAVEDEGDDRGPPFSWFHRSSRPVLWRARDSLYFEPLVALAIVALLLVSLYAYAQNWPPAYVVESDSMQHGSTDQVGLINTGDLVIAERINPSQVVPFVVGAQTGYRTYGEYGDVILYHPNGLTSVSPVIHRAIVYIEVVNGTYSIPELAGLPCGLARNAVYNITGELGECGTTNLLGDSLVLYHVGWMNSTVTIPLTRTNLGSQSGFVTMGDNNFVPGSPPEGLPDEPSVTSLVQPGWVLGVARGMIPWFGALKLLFSGDAGMVPSTSWEFLGLTIAGVLLAAAGVHYALRAEGIEDERRREMEEEEAVEEGPPRRWWGLRRRGDDDEEEEEEAERGSSQEDGRGLLKRLQPRYWGAHRSGGRPPPAVKRAKGKGRRRPPLSDEEDL